ncbi:hypothetical protein BHU61_09465 [Macrococcus epidermidis]|uniref:DNA repair protein n=1 Tax=Macrococcus epidermidis TaxID=1902580 RepID=A0A327ZPU6_9STAP|nr:ATP-binding protein [Macrococcus epidermidis]RAK44372.1 hypothetical protein BHU61_09465 [Macrococcus epidermidis]
MSYGSYWRKWDLHIHTPFTKLNNQFRLCGNENEVKDYWLEYCKLLNEYEAKVLGITDYFSVENYLNLKINRDEYGLKKDIVLFPNIELRVSDLTSRAAHKNEYQNSDSSKSKKRNNSKVNIHLIFNNEVKDDDLINFLRNIQVEDVDGKKINYIDNQDIIFQNGNIEYLPTSKDIINSLEATFGKQYRDNVLIMVPNSDDGISPNTGHGIKNNDNFVKNYVDIINTSNQSCISFYSGQSKRDLGKLFPCISGSDAHSYKEIKEYDKEKSTFIKSDLTFKGLKSILIEPLSRVHIGEKHPDIKLESKVIDTIELNHEYFGGQKLKFNPYLNTIIGGRSSGKSLLLSILAKKSNDSITVKKNNVDYNNLVHEISNKTIIKSKDGNEINNNFNIEFIYQDGLQEIAFDNEKRNIFIKEIIGDNQEIRTFENFKKEIRTTIQNLNLCLEKLLNENEEINNKLINFQNIHTIKQNIKSYESKLSEFQSSLSNEELQVANSISKKTNKIEQYITYQQNKIELLHDLKKQNILNFEETSGNLFNGLHKVIMNEMKNAENRINSYIESRVQRKIDLIDKYNVHLTKLKKNKLYVTYKKEQSNNPEKEKINNLLNREKFNLKARQNYDMALSTNLSSINNTINQIIECLKKCDTEINKELFVKDEVKIKLDVKFNINEVSNIFRNHFSIGQSKYKELAYGQFKEISLWENRDYEINTITIINDFISTIENILNSSLTKEGIFKKNKNISTFLNDISLLIFLTMDFIITYKNYEFNKMSEGKKSFILLVLILSQTDEDTPLLIDQPEDNLDNNAIYNDLITYLCKQKLKRQIFVVSHNANVTVAADSENIIIANEHDEENQNPNNNKFYYTNGSLENDLIERKVCKILEGGTDAFEKRRRRYTFL